MRGWLPLTLGLLAVVIGAVWTVQGLGYVSGSVMTDEKIWAVIGPIAGAGRAGGDLARPALASTLTARSTGEPEQAKAPHPNRDAGLYRDPWAGSSHWPAGAGRPTQMGRTCSACGPF